VRPGQATWFVLVGQLSAGLVPVIGALVSRLQSPAGIDRLHIAALGCLGFAAWASSTAAVRAGDLNLTATIVSLYPMVTAQAAESYRYLLDADGAAEAQAIVAEAQDSSSAYAQLAIYLYADGKIKQGDAAGEKAVEAAEASQRQAIRKNMDTLAEQARKQKKQLAQGPPGGASGGGQGIEDPFGGLSGAGGAAAPLPAPAP
jgi:hypothetical protein